MLKRYCKGFYKIYYLLSVICYWQRILLLPVVFCLLPVFTSGCAGGEMAKKDIKSLSWNTYLFNNQREGNTEDSMELPPRLSSNFMIAGAPMFKFFVPYDPAEYSSPAIVDGIAYVGSADGYFYAIDMTKGREIWEFPVKGAVESSATVSGGRVYFGTGKGVLYCLSGKDGKEIWRFQAKTEIISSPAVEDGVIYFNSADDRLYALKAESGEKLWQYSRRYVKNIVKRIFASPAIYGDKIYYNSADGYVVAVEKSSGREVWQKSVLGAGEEGADTARLTPTIDGSMLYVINGDRFLVALDAEKGEEGWRFNSIRISDFTVSRGYIFIAGYDGSIIAMNKSGKIVWKEKTGQGVPVSMIAVDKCLVVASNYKIENLLSTDIGSHIDIFDMESGKNEWNENIDSTVSASLSAAYNHLLLVTDHGYLRIYKSIQ